MTDATRTHEARVIGLVAAVQFVHVVDFMIILPLGPDLAEPLGIPVSSLAWLAAAYTGAAAVVGLIAAPVLDRFDRRWALGVAMSGLVVATLLGTAATSFTALMLARIVAGSFGGPAAAIGQAIVIDTVPIERRGRAIGVVMGANAVGAILGVPLGLWLATLFDWRAPFVFVAAAGVLVTLTALRWLPPLRDHLGAAARATSTRAMLARPDVRMAYVLIFLVISASFLLTPNLSAFVQFNLGYPRTSIPGLYAMAGAVAIVTMRIVGRVVDHRGAFGIGSAAALGFIAVVIAYLLVPSPQLPVSLGFIALLVSLSSRNVAVRTLTTQVPGPRERARFLSLQSSVHHCAAAVGAGVSALMLTTDANGVLVGMPVLAAMSIGLTVLVPPLLWQLEGAVRGRRVRAYPDKV